MLLYSTYLGGSGGDIGHGIAVDSAGNAYLTGYTDGGFPTTPGAAQTTYGGGNHDAFVAKFSFTPDIPAPLPTPLPTAPVIVGTTPMPLPVVRPTGAPITNATPLPLPPRRP